MKTVLTQRVFTILAFTKHSAASAALKTITVVFLTGTFFARAPLGSFPQVFLVISVILTIAALALRSTGSASVEAFTVVLVALRLFAVAPLALN